MKNLFRQLSLFRPVTTKGNTDRFVISPILRWFLLAMILANFAGNMYRLLLPLYMVDLGASVPQIGLGFSLAAFIPLLFQFAGGWISDHLGRLRTIFLGSIGGFTGYLIMVFAIDWRMMVFGMAIESFSQVAVTPSFSPFIAEQSEKRYRGALFGLTSAIFMIVGVIGPPIGSGIAASIGYRGLLMIGIIPYGLSFILRLGLAIWERKIVSKPATDLNFSSFKRALIETKDQFLNSQLLLWFLVIAGISEILVKISRELLPVYMEKIIHIDLSQIGFLGSFYGIAFMVASITAGRLADKWEPRMMIAIGFFISSTGLLSAMIGHTFITIAMSWALFGIGVGFLDPIFSMLLTQLVPARLLGRAFGLYWTMRSMISLPASWIGSQLWDLFDPALPFIAAAFIGIIFSIVTIKKLTLIKQETV